MISLTTDHWQLITDLQMKRNHQTGRPKLACEIAPDRVIAARAADFGQVLELCSTSELAPGCVIPDLTEGNLREREAVVSALREALGNIGARSGDMVLYFPTPPFAWSCSTLKPCPKSMMKRSVIRFRLRKSLPFDVDKAKVSYQAQTANGATRVVAAVALNSIVEDYENARSAMPASLPVVMPSMLAALGGASADRPTLVVKVDARTTSIAILDRGITALPIFENTRGVTISGEQLAEDVYPSVVFFQDTYNTSIEEIFVAGISDSPARHPRIRKPAQK